jgi:prophage antirepressor-like protein
VYNCGDDYQHGISEMSNFQKSICRDISGTFITAHGTLRRPLFLVEDVMEWLEYEDVSAMLQNVDDDEVIRTIPPPEQCLAGLQPNTEYQFLTEAGFYELLMLSQTPVAKRFKKGVKQVLYDVRTGTGIMEMDNVSLCDPSFFVKSLLHRYFGFHRSR